MKKNNDSEPIEVEIIEEDKEQGKFHRFINKYKKVIIIGLLGILVLIGGGFAIEAINEWKDEVNIKAQNTKVSLDQAKKIALDKVPGSTIKDFELEKEGNRYIFEIEVLKGREETEFEIDAESGEILSQEIDNK